MTERQDPACRIFPPNAIHLVRTSQQMQLQLSQMADQKASILMGATFVIFTLAVGQIRTGGMMLLPITILAVTAFLSALLAIYTVLPSVTRSTAGVQPHENLLFFGIFTALPEADFIDRALENMESDESTYRAMLRDIYQNGLVLQRKKYRFLGYAYRVFLVGLIMTAVTVAAEAAVGRFI